MPAIPLERAEKILKGAGRTRKVRRVGKSACSALFLDRNTLTC